MKKEIINTNNAPAPVGPYSQAVKANGFIFVSGCIPLTPDTNEIVSDVKEAARLVFSNLKNILEAGGSDFSKVVKVTIFLSDMSMFQEVNKIYSEFAVEPFPARSTIAVKELPGSVCIEADAIALA
ncbi:MAG: Rid family detoxifying hydrolase [Spirochaetota bacterium]